MVLKIIVSIFMACFFLVQTKTLYDDIVDLEKEQAKVSDIVIDCIILFLVILTMLCIWF